MRSDFLVHPGRGLSLIRLWLPHTTNVMILLVLILLRAVPLSAHNGAVAIAVSVDGIVIERMSRQADRTTGLKADDYLRVPRIAYVP